MLKVGIAGLRRGRALLSVFANLTECEVVAVCDPKTDVADEVSKRWNVPWVYGDFDSFIEADMDIVVVATPREFHVSQSIAALERGMHVLCEVPAVVTLDECEPLVKAVRNGPGKYMMAENCNFWAFIESWREMVTQGRIGKIIYAEAEYIHAIPQLMRTPDGKPTWRAFLPPIHYCTHSLGPILSLADDRCVSVVGMNTGSNVDTEFGTIDMEAGLFKTASGAVIKILTGFSLIREPAFHYYSVYGTRGVLERGRGQDRCFGYFKDVPNLHGMVELPLTTSHPRLPAWAASGGHGTAEYMMIKAFVDAIVEDKEPPIDVYRALDYTVPGLCAHISAEEGGRPVDIPDFRQL
jgi:predicted dehydrogenase